MEFDKRSRKFGEPTTVKILFIAVFVLLLVFSAIGFPVVMLRSRGEVPDWSLQFGAVELGGSTGSLVCFLMLVISLWFVTKVKSPKRKRNRLSTWERRLLMPGRLIGILLPVATFLVWAGF